MNKNKQILIEAPSYQSSYQQRSDHLLHLRQHFHKMKPSVETDIFAKSWNILFANLPIGCAKVNHSGKLVDLDGPIAIFVPPFSILEFVLNGQAITFDAYFSNTNLPDFAPRNPTLFRNFPAQSPQKLEDIFEILRSPPESTEIGRGDSICRIAAETKELIDQTFDNHEILLSDVAKQVGHPQAVISRKFKKTFGFSPVFYRNRLRVQDAMMMKMLFDAKSVTETFNSSGFDDLSRFNSQFKNYYRVPPSKFKQKK